MIIIILLIIRFSQRTVTPTWAVTHCCTSVMYGQAAGVGGQVAGGGGGVQIAGGGMQIAGGGVQVAGGGSAAATASAVRFPFLRNSVSFN